MWPWAHTRQRGVSTLEMIDTSMLHLIRCDDFPWLAYLDLSPSRAHGAGLLIGSAAAAQARQHKHIEAPLVAQKATESMSLRGVGRDMSLRGSLLDTQSHSDPSERCYRPGRR